jgi:hypothetical protein
MMTPQEREASGERFPTLWEMSLEYKYTAATISKVLKLMRKELKETDDPDRRCVLSHRIYTLTVALSNMNAMAEMCERYYDRNYHAPAQYSLNVDRKPIKKTAADIAGVEQEIESFRGVVW